MHVGDDEEDLDNQVAKNMVEARNIGRTEGRKELKQELAEARRLLAEMEQRASKAEELFAKKMQTPDC
jgi:hypothetical protein